MPTLNLLPADVRHELELLAKDVQTKGNDPKTANLLRDLGEAVAGGSTFDYWVQADVLELIPPERVTDVMDHSNSSGLERWVGIFEWARNVAILLPLIVTWFGISRAMDAYTAMLAEGRVRENDSFLYLWSNGFDGKTIALGQIALAVVVCLAFVLVLTGIVYALNGRAEHQRREASLQFRTTLEELLARAVLILANQRAQQPFLKLGAIERTAEQILDQIRLEEQRIEEQRKQIESLRGQKEKEIADLSSFNKSLVNGTKQMVEATNQLHAIYDELTHSMDGLATPVRDLSKQQTELLNATLEVSKEFKQLTQDQNTAVIKLTRLSNDQQQATSNLDQVSKNLDVLVKTLTQNTERLGQIAEQTGAYEREFLTALTGERVAYQNYANNLTTGADKLSEAMRQISDASLIIRTISVDLKQIVGEIKAMQRA